MLTESEITEIIEDHRTQRPPTTPRLSFLNRVPGRASAVIGLRRSGKSSFLKLHAEELKSKGVHQDQILFVNLEDARLDLEDPKLLSRVFDVFLRNSKGEKGNTTYVFLDEIQEYKNWEKFVRGLLDQQNVEVFLTGSSSRMLSREIATNMRGRSISTEFFPFSFAEMLVHRRFKKLPNNKYSSIQRAQIEQLLQEYLGGTGFPELADLTEDLQQLALRDYLDVIVFRDIVERHQVSAVHALRQLVRQAMASSAKLFSVSKFHGDLKARNIPASKETCLQLLDHLQDTFAVFLVPQFSFSERERQSKVKKIYVGDLGFSKLFRTKVSDDQGQQLETAVFLEIRRHCAEIHFFKSSDNLEVDFLFSYKGVRHLIQASWTLLDPTTKERELRALRSALKLFPDAVPLIVTAFESASIEVEGVQIEVIPAWRWFLHSAPWLS